jgi:hypothetical protein
MKTFKAKVKSKNDIIKTLRINGFVYNSGVYDKDGGFVSFDEEMFRYCNKEIVIYEDTNSEDYDFIAVETGEGWIKDWFYSETLMET